MYEFDTDVWIPSDEAGYEVLIGTPESAVPSALYSERAYLLSKGYIKFALSSPPQELEDVIRWLYINSDGPRLLLRIVEDCKRMKVSSLRGKEAMSHDAVKGKEGGWAAGRISAGAIIPLNKHLLWLEQFLKEHEAAVNAHAVE